MRLFFSTLVFFCFATVSAQCIYGDIEITVTGSSNKRIILTNTANGESFQSYDTSPNYDYSFFPEALNSVTGSRNIGLGASAGQNITSGSGNVIIGEVDADAVDSARTLKIASKMLQKGNPK